MSITSAVVLGTTLNVFNDKLNDVLTRVGNTGANAEVLPYHFINGHYQTIVIIRKEVV